jgi:hypothetical protein
MCWRGPAAIVNGTHPLERMLHRTRTASVQLENKITGRESQVACHQDELIGGEPSVIKLTLTLT